MMRPYILTAEEKSRDREMSASFGPMRSSIDEEGDSRAMSCIAASNRACQCHVSAWGSVEPEDDKSDVLNDIGGDIVGAT